MLPRTLKRFFKKYPEARFISVNEFIGYLHAQTSGKCDNSGKLALSIFYDSHYCKYFEDHNSTWNLEFADWLIDENGSPQIHIDGKETTPISKIINVRPGLGKHILEIEFYK